MMDGRCSNSDLDGALFSSIVDLTKIDRFDSLDLILWLAFPLRVRTKYERTNLIILCSSLLHNPVITVDKTRG